MKTTTKAALYCPVGCITPMDMHAKHNGMHVRRCPTCGYKWLANPVIDSLQQKVQPKPEVSLFTMAEISKLDQLQRYWSEHNEMS